jgi:hypothetical protein
MNKNGIIYSYVSLRYVHDDVTGEFLNVGLVAFNPLGRTIKSKFSPNLLRVLRAFPSVQIVSLRKRLDALHRFLSQPELAFDSIEKALTAALPGDDSALQWSQVGAGVAQNFDAVLDELFERIVARFDISYEIVEDVSDSQRVFRPEGVLKLPACNDSWGDAEPLFRAANG